MAIGTVKILAKFHAVLLKYSSKFKLVFVFVLFLFFSFLFSSYALIKVFTGTQP